MLELPAEPLGASLHPGKFGRVLDNLIGNALNGGTVTVGMHEHGGRPRLTVRDTGISIPGKLHGQLFDKFSPARRAYKARRPQAWACSLSSRS